MTPENKSFASLMSDARCGCGPQCEADDDASEVIVCTLSGPEFKERTASIQDLARRFLRKAVRPRKNKLALTYDAGALAELQEIVALERQCCAFLDFDLRSKGRDTILTITAPERAAESAELLFRHFAPDTIEHRETAQ